MTPSVSWHKTGEQYIGYTKKTIQAGREQTFIESTLVEGKPTVFLSIITPTKNSSDQITGVAKVSVEITPEMLRELNQTMQERDN